jgi:alpha-beta hydrolase superfamily lysophospholipase
MRHESVITDGGIRINVQRLEMRDGTSMALRTWEHPANEETPGLLFILHGLGGHSGYYEEFGSSLSGAGPFVCALDRRGHGMSGGPRGDISSWKCDALDVQETLGWIQKNYPGKKIYFLGDSWGCLCAMYYVSGSTENISGVILASPPVRLIVTKRWFKPCLRLIGEVIKNLLHLRINGEIGPPFPLDLASRDARFFEKLRTDKYTNFKMTTRYGIFALWLLSRAKYYGARVKTPILLLQGEADMLVDQRGARRLFQIIPATDKRLVMIPNAQHTLYYDPETPYVIKTILEWLSQRTT